MALGFRMLAEKREDLASQANKLRGGLSKIDDTRLKVNEMAAELEITQEQVYKSTRECEEFLVTIGTCHPLNVDASSLGAFTSNRKGELTVIVTLTHDRQLITLYNWW